MHIDIQDPTTIFSYAFEQRLQCVDCKKVRYVTEDADILSVSIPATEKDREGDGTRTIYEDVELTTSLDRLLTAEALEYNCPNCKKMVHALKCVQKRHVHLHKVLINAFFSLSRQTKFFTFPETLIVHAKKFQLLNWVPTKLDIPVILPVGDVLEFTGKHVGKGLQPGEQELGEARACVPPLFLFTVGSYCSCAVSPLPQFDAEALAQLLSMGFSENRCHKALLATGNSNADLALGWLLEHSEDPGEIANDANHFLRADQSCPDIDAPIQGGEATTLPEPPGELVSMLMDMGFTCMQANKALRQTVRRALFLYEFSSHFESG